MANIPFIRFLFSPVGRIRRRDYWLGSIGVIAASFLVKAVALAVFWHVEPSMIVPQMNVWKHPNATPIAVFLWAVMLVSLVSSMCISAKRWHDRNRTGWFALTGPVQLALSMSGLGYTQGDAERTQTEAVAYLVIMAVSGALAIWVFVECGILDGTKGPNRYGPSPKGAGEIPDVF